MTDDREEKDRQELYDKLTLKRLPENKFVGYQPVLEKGGLAIELVKIAEIRGLLWLPETLDEDGKSARIVRAIELYEGLEPQDAAEGMLAVQMVGTHFAALECLRRAAIPNQTFVGRDMALKHAQKLMALYAKQLETLNKHRGKGQQKVTVEHVNVEPGGQAIVGNVEASQSKGRSGEAPQAIEHRPEEPLPKVKPRSKVTTRKRSD